MLRLDVNLSLAGPRGVVHLEGRGDALTLRAARLGPVIDLARTLRNIPPASPLIEGPLPAGGAGLSRANIRCKVEVGGRALGEAGRGVRASWWAAALRWPELRVPLHRLVWTWIRNR